MKVNRGRHLFDRLNYLAGSDHERVSDLQEMFSDPEVRAIFKERIIPLLENDSFSDPIEWTSALEMWWGGEYGIYFMGSWTIGMVDEPDDLGVFTLPAAEGVVAGGDWAWIPQYSEHVEEAKQLIAFMVSKEGTEIRAQQGGGKLATRTGVSLDAYPPADRHTIPPQELVPQSDLLGTCPHRAPLHSLPVQVLPLHWLGLDEALTAELFRSELSVRR